MRLSKIREKAGADWADKAAEKAGVSASRVRNVVRTDNYSNMAIWEAIDQVVEENQKRIESIKKRINQ